MKLLMWIIIFGFMLRNVHSDLCPQTTACSATCYRSTTTYTDCGLFWWSSCSDGYRSRAYSCYQTCYKKVCCTGYTGDSCTTPLCDGSMSCRNGGTCRSPDYCVCPTGFSSPRCNDIDECSGTSHGCQHNCANTAGSYNCTCRTGYELSDDLRSCIDIDECSRAFHGCQQVCRNTVGSFYCSCRTGYVRTYDLKSCIDKDECSGTSHGCRHDCMNTVGSYYCTCRAGYVRSYDLKSCIDIQPPVVTGCSENITINATDLTVQYNWTEPTFTDPFGNDLDIVSNYPTPEFTFPWGNYTVQYVATKKSNGLQTECSFRIEVMPTPCKELNVPDNGALLCNGWKTDYGRFCMIMCQQNYTIGPTRNYYTWYVCGASGNWIAASPVPNCEVPVVYEYEDEYYLQKYAGYVYPSSCKDDATRSTLQTLYIEYLNGTKGFSSFCSTYESECIKENVDVKC